MKRIPTPDEAFAQVPKKSGRLSTFSGLPFTDSDQ